MWYTRFYKYDRKESYYEIFRKTSDDHDRHRDHRDIPFCNFCQIFLCPFVSDRSLPPAVDGASDDTGGARKKKLSCRAQADRP